MRINIEFIISQLRQKRIGLPHNWLLGFFSQIMTGKRGTMSTDENGGTNTIV